MRNLAILEVAPGIWSVRRGAGGSAAYVVKTSPGAVLVDAGEDPRGVDVMRALQTARVGLSSVSAILLTHGHRHAASGARALRERSGAPLLCAREEAGATKARSFFSRRHAPVVVEADDHLEDGAAFRDFEVLATPGHTPGHLSFLYRPARALFAGDALRGDGAGLSLARGTRRSDVALESLERCASAGARIVLPCHGPPIGGEALSGLRRR